MLLTNEIIIFHWKEYLIGILNHSNAILELALHMFDHFVFVVHHFGVAPLKVQLLHAQLCVQPIFVGGKLDE